MTVGSHGVVIVGCGVISSMHVKAIRALPNARLVAAVDTVSEKAKELAATEGARALTDLDEALRLPGVDVVCVCVPSGLHAEIGVRAARAGKHVVVEKPMDVTLAAADRLIAACKDSGVKLTVISQRRFENVFRKVHDLATNGGLGGQLLGTAELKWFRSQQYYESAEWRGTWELDGGGALMNQGVHYIDLLRWMMGPVEWVSAVCETKAHTGIEVEDVALAHIKFTSGALASVDASTAAFPGLKERLELTGSNGTVVVESGVLTLLETREGLRDSELIGPQETSQPSASSDPKMISAGGHAAQLGDFLSAIEEEREPFVSGADGRAAIELILSIYESARQGQRVFLPVRED